MAKIYLRKEMFTSEDVHRFHVGTVASPPFHQTFGDLPWGMRCLMGLVLSCECVEVRIPRSVVSHTTLAFGVGSFPYEVIVGA